MAQKLTLQRVGEFVAEKAKNPYILGGTMGLLTLVIILTNLHKAARKVIRAARKWVGVKEIYDNQGWSNSTFQKGMEEIGWYTGADWCNFFVKFVILSCCKKNSKAYQFWSTNLSPATQTTWSNLKNGSDYHEVVDKPVKGSLVIYRNNNDPSHGHIEIVESVNSDGTYKVISGNSKFTDQSGYGVAEKTRYSNGLGVNYTTLGFIKIKKV